MKRGILQTLTRPGSHHYLLTALLFVATAGVMGAQNVTMSVAATSVGSCGIAGINSPLYAGVVVTPTIVVKNSSTSSLSATVKVSEYLVASSGATTGASSLQKTVTVPALGHITFKANSITARDGYNLYVGASSTTGPTFSCHKSVPVAAQDPPMTAITVNSFSPTASPVNNSSCNLTESVTFTPNGSGTVNVTWSELSSKTSSAVENPYSYKFYVGSTKTDSTQLNLQGLESGDSYRIYATLTDASNPSVTTTAGPFTITSCAGPTPLLSPNVASSMTSPVTPGSLTVTQHQDLTFANECEMNLKQSFTTSGGGSVEVVYLFTSSDSVGGSYYTGYQVDFGGPGGASDSSYTRMPAGHTYSIVAKINVLGDPSHSATSAPISVQCT